MATAEAMAGDAAAVAELPLDTIIHGDALDVLRGLPDGCVDAVVTDPPYGLGEAPDMLDVLRAWLAGEFYVPRGRGFMGKAWDAFVPGPEYWREVYRLLRPGGHALVFAGTRTWDVMGLALRLAGFELRDTLQWLYGSGFPKSLDVSKAIDRAAGAARAKVRPVAVPARNRDGTNALGGSWQDEPWETAPATREAHEWQGWGTALKPAWEPIIVCRRPLAERTVAANVLRWGTGAINVDGCRIGSESVKTQAKSGPESCKARLGANGWSGTPESWHLGRWPANLVLSHTPDCRPLGTKRVRGGTAVRHRSGGNTFGGNNVKPPLPDSSYTDADGLETVEAWECVDGCPVRELDAQSGVQVARNGAHRGTAPGLFGLGGDQGPQVQYRDTGGASRFFYVAKASRRERNAGCEGLEERIAGGLSGRRDGTKGSVTHNRNTHPTVKPLALMRWLCRLITPPGGIVLDPFAGSGTTCVAARAEGMHYLGIEREAEYVAIARARVDAATVDAAGK